MSKITRQNEIKFISEQISAIYHRRTERTQESINLLQEKLIEELKKSARKNGLDISKSTVHLTESLNAN